MLNPNSKVYKIYLAGKLQYWNIIVFQQSPGWVQFLLPSLLRKNLSRPLTYLSRKGHSNGGSTRTENTYWFSSTFISSFPKRGFLRYKEVFQGFLRPFLLSCSPSKKVQTSLCVEGIEGPTSPQNLFLRETHHKCSYWPFQVISLWHVGCYLPKWVNALKTPEKHLILPWQIKIGNLTRFRGLNSYLHGRVNI